MPDLFAISYSSTPLLELIKGFQNRYANLFPDFSQVTIILPNNYAIAQASNCLRRLYAKQNFILPNFVATFDLTNSSNFQTSKISKLDILSFLRKKQKNSKKDLFKDPNYLASLNIKQLIHLADDIYNSSHNLTEQNSAYHNLVLALANEYNSLHNKHKKNALLDQSAIIIFLEQEASPLNCKIKQYLNNKTKHTDINIINIGQETTEKTKWLEAENISKQQNISYFIAQDENEEILAATQILQANLKQNIRTHIICLDNNFAASLKEKLAKQATNITKNKIISLIISLLIKEITATKFKDELSNLSADKINISKEEIEQITQKPQSYNIQTIIRAVEELIKLINQDIFIYELVELSQELAQISHYNFNYQIDELKTLLLFLFDDGNSNFYQDNFAILTLEQAALLEADKIIISNFKKKINIRGNDGKFNKLKLLLQKKDISFTWQYGNKQSSDNIFFYEQEKHILETGTKLQINFKKTKLSKQEYVRPPSSTKKHDFSVTDIEKLLINPYEIYAKKILNIRPKRHKIIPEIEYGNALHFALAEFCKLHKNNPPSRASELILEQLEKYIRANKLENFALVFSEKTKSIIPQIIKFEQESQAEFDNNLVETKLEYHLQNDIKIYGRIDRINFHKHKLAIIDFKTGALASKKAIYSGQKGQILISALLAKKKFPRLEIDCYYLKFHHKNQEIKKIDYSDEIENNLYNLLLQYQHEDSKLYIKPDPNIEYPDEYKHLCRK